MNTGLGERGACTRTCFPVLHERTRTHHKNALGQRLAVVSVRLEHRVQDGHRLQGLTETHIVGENAPVAVVVFGAHDAPEGELAGGGGGRGR